MAQSFDIETVKAKINEFVEKVPAVNEPLITASQKIGVEKAYVVMAAVAVPILLILSIGCTTLIIDAIGFAYPMYMSMKALETVDKEDDKQWLTYWIIFAMFKIVEGTLGGLLSMIPFYFLGKVGFLVWCYYPSTQGATVLYNTVIKPYVIPSLGFPDEPHNKSE